MKYQPLYGPPDQLPPGLEKPPRFGKGGCMGLLLGGIFFLGTFRMPGSYDDQPTNAGIYAAIFLVGGMIIDAIDSLRVEQRNTQRLLVRILAQRDKTPGD